MLSEGVIAIILLVVLIVLVLGGMSLYWRMRADNGYNMGRNYMLDLGFSDEDIKRGQDDRDKELYVFRKENDHKGDGKDHTKQ